MRRRYASWCVQYSPARESPQLKLMMGQVRLQQAQLPPRRISLLLTDVHMEDATGVDLAKAITSVFPCIPVLFMSAWGLPPEVTREVPAARSCWTSHFCRAAAQSGSRGSPRRSGIPPKPPARCSVVDLMRETSRFHREGNASDCKSGTPGNVPTLMRTPKISLLLCAVDATRITIGSSVSSGS